MTRALRSAALALCLTACRATSPEVDPGWLAELIATFESEPVASPPLYIAYRAYTAGVYYYVPARCCDIFSDLYDAEGALVCHPDGGITGGGDGQCPFLGALLREEIVWRDSRSGP